MFVNCDAAAPLRKIGPLSSPGGLGPLSPFGAQFIGQSFRAPDVAPTENLTLDRFTFYLNLVSPVLTQYGIYPRDQRAV